MFKVAICGIDGAGKSFLIENLVTYFQNLGITVDKTKVEFHCKEICNHANLLKEKNIVRIGMAFDFVNHYIDFKSSSQLLICDRFDVCYRVLNRVDALDNVLIEQLDKLYSIIEDADLYLYLDLPVDIAAKRLEARGNRVDNESDKILQLMQHHYESELAKKKNIAVIDASQSFAIVFETAKRFINKLMR